ncbi:MAG: MOSC domain-containing protein [Bacteroidota bacterium]
MSPLNKSLRELVTQTPLVGKVEWIGIRSTKREDLTTVTQIEASVARGLAGDHYAGRSAKRQVTLIQAEHLKAVAEILGKSSPIAPNLTRRNLVISGINLLAFKDLQFQIGAEVILEMTGLCHPCSRMEENLGPGGYHAMRSHGGITAKVIQGGSISLGDPVRLLATGTTD